MEFELIFVPVQLSLILVRYLLIKWWSSLCIYDPDFCCFLHSSAEDHSPFLCFKGHGVSSLPMLSELPACNRNVEG